MAVEFQKTINADIARGIPGAFASINPHVSTPKGYIAGKDVGIGTFVWTADDFTVENTGTGTPLGFVHRVNAYTFQDVTQGASNKVPAGQAVDVLVAGDFFVLTAAQATRGQKVFAKTTDGTIVPGNKGATVEGVVETNFYFAEDVKAGEVGIITSVAI